MAQLINLTSEALQATVRRLLPSQQGFGEDLQATNVVTPIIDLTPTAEGSSVPQILQQAVAFGSSTRILAQNSTQSLVTGGGFYRLTGSATLESDGSASVGAGFSITDGATSLDFFSVIMPPTTGISYISETYDLTVFLRPADELQAFSTTTSAVITGSFRQTADSNGNLVNPSGFTPQ